jgi:hypothetical protein
MWLLPYPTVGCLPMGFVSDHTCCRRLLEIKYVKTAFSRNLFCNIAVLLCNSELQYLAKSCLILTDRGRSSIFVKSPSVRPTQLARYLKRLAIHPHIAEKMSFIFTYRNPEMQLDRKHTAVVLADIQNEFLIETQCLQ